MSTSAIRVIETAIAALLVGDATLMTLITDVVGDIPDEDELEEGEPLYPLIMIGHATEKPWHTMGGPTTGLGWVVIIRVHVYSRYAGDLEALMILERVVTLLNFVNLTVVGYETVMCEYIQGRVLVESVDKIETRHIPAEFKVSVHQ